MVFVPENLLLRSSPDSSSNGEAGLLEQEKEATDSEEERVILCAFCGHEITRPDQEVTIQGGHRHTFANPHGFVFDICCFRKADGCRVSAESSWEFTWFSGYCWHFASCRGCSRHLGWWFESKEDAFFGLITDNIIFP